MLEVGCGAGELALELSGAGYDVVAIDPDAPAGDIFRRTTIDELDDAGGFDAAVAARSLHHVEELDAAVAKLAALAPLLVVDEFVWDRADEATLDWYEGQRRLLVAAGHAPASPPADEWVAHHEHLHGYDRLNAALDRHFHTRVFEWVPYLYRYLGGPASETLEEGLVAARAIRAIGFRYVGERKQ